MNEYVEVSARSVDVAVEAAMAELGVDNRAHVEVEVVQDPSKGFLGIGRTEAIVKVGRKPKPRNRGRNRSRSKSGSRGGQSNRSRQPKSTGNKASKSDKRQSDDKPKADRARGSNNKSDSNVKNKEKAMEGPTAEEIADQVRAVDEFLTGLLGSFGLEGDVKVRDEEGIIYAEVTGEQTEALVGPKGSVMTAVQELSRTVIQRRSRNSARVRVDIANYRARRSEALAIYTKRLSEQLLEDGGEVMLEPMNAADRKVVHDTAGEIEGVTTFSEGREPRRSVVLSTEG